MPEQPARYYYIGPRRVPLELVDDTVSVALTRPIPERRRAALAAGRQPLDALARSPALMGRNILIHRTTPVARGAEGLQKLAARMVKAPSVRFVTHVFRHPETGLHMILTDEIAVRFTPEVTQAQIDALNASHGVEVIERKPYAPNQYLMRVQDPSPQRALDVANAYQESGLVEWAEPNFIMEVRLHQDFKDRQWHLENTGQGGGTRGEDARVRAAGVRGSPNVTIAILDTGVDMAHPGLTNLNAEFSRNFTGGPVGDPSPDVDPSSATAHGTSCAGVAAGSGGKIDGVAPGCRLLAIKVMSVQTLPTTPPQVRFSLDPNLTAEAFRHSAQHAHVLSNSWFAPQSNQLEQAINDVMATGREGKGTIVLFATGNTNQPITPGAQARIDGVIAVGASTNVGSRASYSTFGEDIDAPPNKKRLSVLGPSAGTDSLGVHGINLPFPADNSTENIFTTDIRGAAGANPPASPSVTDPATDPDYTGLFSGTSSATPLVAGVCALMLSVKSDLTRAQVRYLLEATADKIGTGGPHAGVPPGSKVPAGDLARYNPVTGHDPKFGFGRVNAEQAVRAARGEPIRQFVRNGGAGAFQPAISVVLRRVPGTNHFVSDAEIEVVDARRDPETPVPAGGVRVFAAPTGFLRAAFQPTGGGPPLTDEVDVQGVMT